MPENSTVVFGMGTGRCGTASLAKLLNNQADAQVTHELWPILPWKAKPTTLVERIRLLQARPAGIVGDVASSYLPHLESCLESGLESNSDVYKNVRVIGLERPRDEVVESFSRWLDEIHPLPIDHWSEQPAEGFYRDILWSRSFPKYSHNDRKKSIAAYWDEYHQRLSALVSKHPKQVRVFNYEEALNQEVPQRELLEFAGVAADSQQLELNVQGDHFLGKPIEKRPVAKPAHPANLVVTSQINGKPSPTQQHLMNFGHVFWSLNEGVDLPTILGRTATTAVRRGFLEWLWMDHRAEIDQQRLTQLRLAPEDVSLILEQPLAGNVLRPTDQPIAMRVRRQVFFRLRDQFALPFCDATTPEPWLPFFVPEVVEQAHGAVYLSPIAAFLNRVQNAECSIAVIP